MKQQQKPNILVYMLRFNLLLSYMVVDTKYCSYYLPNLKKKCYLIFVCNKTVPIMLI